MQTDAPTQPNAVTPALALGAIDADEALLRLGVAALVGAAIGLDRDLRGKPAGVRTHGLVSLGAALVTLVSVHFAGAGLNADGNAVTRTIQGVIAGVGFLGAGVIMKGSDANTVQGLTTAATIWLVACLGVAAGAGLWMLTATTGLITFLLLLTGGPFERLIRRLTAGPREEQRRRLRERRERRRARKRRPPEQDEEASGTGPAIS